MHNDRVDIEVYVYEPTQLEQLGMPHSVWTRRGLVEVYCVDGHAVDWIVDSEADE